MLRVAQIAPAFFVHSRHPWRSQDAQEQRMVCFAQGKTGMLTISETIHDSKAGKL